MNLLTEEYIIYYSKLTDTGSFLKKQLLNYLKTLFLCVLGNKKQCKHKSVFKNTDNNS